MTVYQVSQVVNTLACLWKTERLEKGHGRIEFGEYECYDLLELKTADRWQPLQLKTGVKVNRIREELKSGKSSREESYEVSNQLGNYQEILAAIRKHWSVETNNHLRDVSFSQDTMRSKKRTYSKQWEVSEAYQS